MLKEYLENNIHFLPNVSDWKQGIRESAQPLLENGTVEPRYVDAMIQNVIDNGNYIIIIPEVAIPHARHEYGAMKTGISFLKLEEPVQFPEESPVYLFFALASETSDGHLDILAELGEVLSDPDKVEELKQAKTASEVLNILDAI
ncbi:PTS sugar transporter subunit IIA [Oceanobacillus jeddahense]|uniref:Ascorbate-specific PTS system EIIA component n=1 Tax=Oceanobacillus jeddahense TaxID=1462527 RepID=A0ABY5JU44_9BACI|nr:PTS sugar transporter subunit IIA [Oceanobacillus jeddahense]UUI02997.1 PTS sugar transporter subunit IIA [Oceanobacillus jeddahense]